MIGACLLRVLRFEWGGGKNGWLNLGYRAIQYSLLIVWCVMSYILLSDWDHSDLWTRSLSMWKVSPFKPECCSNFTASIRFQKIHYLKEPALYWQLLFLIGYDQWYYLDSLSHRRPLNHRLCLVSLARWSILAATFSVPRYEVSLSIQ